MGTVLTMTDHGTASVTLATNPQTIAKAAQTWMSAHWLRISAQTAPVLICKGHGSVGATKDFSKGENNCKPSIQKILDFGPIDLIFNRKIHYAKFRSRRVSKNFYVS